MHVKIRTIAYQDYPEMDDELPILKGILNGEVKYHNARRYLLFLSVALVQSDDAVLYNLYFREVTSGAFFSRLAIRQCRV